jgi:hypothetical protein
MHDKLKKSSIITPEYFNRVLKNYHLPKIDFAETMQPGETIDHWMEDVKEANKIRPWCCIGGR